MGQYHLGFIFGQLKTVMDIATFIKKNKAVWDIFYE